MNKLEELLSKTKMKEIIESTKKNDKLKKVLIACAIIAGVTIAAILIYRYFRPDKYDDFDDDFFDDVDEDL